MAQPPENMPQMGTPEFREFVKTPEWLEWRHELALKDHEVWEEHQRYMDERTKAIASGQLTVLGAGPEPTRDPFINYSSIFSRDWRQRLAPDDPYRMEYEESVYGRTEAELRAEDAKAFEVLHEIGKRAARQLEADGIIV